MAEPRYAGFLPGIHLIEGYGSGGFRFGGMSHRGSILALPSGIRAWPVTKPEEIGLATLALLFEEEQGAIGHLLIGTGTGLLPLKSALREELRARGILAEPMATGAAARTYNILIGENRRVAAALLAVD
jgi:uncharacterized protein